MLDCGSRSCKFESCHSPLRLFTLLFKVRFLTPFFARTRGLSSPYFMYTGAWLNFFKESFLVDYITKWLFINFTTQWLLKGAFFFNFSFINRYQIKSLLLFFYYFGGILSSRAPDISRVLELSLFLLILGSVLFIIF